MSAKQQQQSRGNATAAGGGGGASALPLYATKQESAGANGATNGRGDATGPYVDAGVYRYERDRKSHEFFSPGPHSTERTVKAPSAIFNLASTIIGGGILSLPYAFEKCGLVLAFVFMIVSAVASNFSLYVIVSCSRRGGATTYEEIVRKALGPKAGLITVTLLVLLTFLTMVAYVILMKDLVSSLGEQFLFARAISTAEQNMLTIVCIALVSPVLFAKSMDALRYTSIFSLCAVFLLAIAVAIRSVQSLQSADGNVAVMNSESVSIKLFPSNWRDPVFAFPIISISFLCHFNVLPVYRELHKPTRHRLKKIVSATMFSTWAFYMVVATMGYLFAYRLPGGVKDDILNNFSINDSLINVGRLGLLVTIMMNLPLIMQPCRMNTIRLGKYVSGFMKTYKSRSSNGEDIALLTTPTAMHEAVTPAVRNQNVFHVALTIAIICGVVALALVLPGVAVVWNMVGSTVGILISYVLPCMSYIIIRKNRERTDRRKVTAWIILVVGSIMCVACTLQAFKLFNIQIKQPMCSHLAEKKRPRTTQEPRALYEPQAAPLKQEKASAMTDKHAAPPPASFSTLLTVDPPASTAPTSANAPLSTGPYVDTGVYRYERNRKSHEFFSPGPHSKERTATAPSAVFNLVSTIIGGGILSLPYAFDKCGLVLGFLFMVVSAAASNFSLYVIVSCSRRGGATTYEEVVRKALGPKAGLVAVTLLVMLTFLTMVAYVILIKDLVGSLGEHFLFARAVTVVEKNVLTIICIALVSPVLFAKSMDALRFTSIFSLVSVLVLAIAITIRAVYSIEDNDTIDTLRPDPIEIKLFPSDWRDPVYAFPIISVSFLCHFNVLPVYRELHKPTRQRLKKIVSATMVSTWVFYMIVGTMGYLFAYQLPSGVKDDILNNFDGSDALVNVGRLGLLVTIMLSMPLIMQPCRLNILRLANYVRGFAKSYRSTSLNGEDIRLLTTPTAAATPRDAVRRGSRASRTAKDAMHVALTVVLISGAVALALVLPGVAVVWNMMGSTVGILISYVLPCISYVAIRKKKPTSDARKLTAWGIFLASSVIRQQKRRLHGHNKATKTHKSTRRRSPEDQNNVRAALLFLPLSPARPPSSAARIRARARGRGHAPGIRKRQRAAVEASSSFFSFLSIDSRDLPTDSLSQPAQFQHAAGHAVMVARTVTGNEMRSGAGGSSRSGGQQTAERSDGALVKKTVKRSMNNAMKKNKQGDDAVVSTSSGLFHTVTASTPRAKRMARVYPHSNTVMALQVHQLQAAPSRVIADTAGGSGGGSCMSGLPPQRRPQQDAGDDEDQENDTEGIPTWCTMKSSRRASYQVENSSDCEGEMSLPLMPTRITRQLSNSSSISFNSSHCYQNRSSECYFDDDDDASVSATVAGYRDATTGLSTTSHIQDDILSRIATLKALCDQGFISSDEYERRKCAIVDELTFPVYSSASDENGGDEDDDDYEDYGDDYEQDQGTLLATQFLTTTQPSRMSFGRPSEGLPLIVPHAPNFQDIKPELATKHVFDYVTRQWSSSQVQIALDETPFSKGSLRVVYHLLDLTRDDENDKENQSQPLSRRRQQKTRRKNYVAKLAIDPDEDPQTYFRDTELQAHCAHYAQMYNSYNPPKRVEFIEAWVLELTERNGALCAVEPYIPGEYRKHNNNFGSVSDDERNTPQSFSHFTYEASNHKLLAVDIQGVGDMYTDPQIHTLNGNDFGKGNLGVLGFQKFLSSHRCNLICRYLKLPSVNPKDRHADSGTLPIQELMNRDRVRPMQFDSKHYYENAPMLQKYITQCRELEGKNGSAATNGGGKAKVQSNQHGLLLRILSRLFCCGGQ